MYRINENLNDNKLKEKCMANTKQAKVHLCQYQVAFCICLYTLHSRSSNYKRRMQVFVSMSLCTHAPHCTSMQRTPLHEYLNW